MGIGTDNGSGGGGGGGGGSGVQGKEEERREKKQGYFRKKNLKSRGGLKSVRLKGKSNIAIRYSFWALVHLPFLGVQKTSSLTHL